MVAGGLAWVTWRGWAALGAFFVQNTVAVLLLRWTQIIAITPYSSLVAVLMQELAVKLPASMILYAIECKGVCAASRALCNDVRTRPKEWGLLMVPAVLYTIQMTCLYIGYANVEPAVGQVTYQSKVFFTALFSICLLGKRQSSVQWLALAFLSFGIIAVQQSGAKKHKGERKVDAHRNMFLGISALVLGAICVAIASVFFEMMLKSDSKPSLWLRNIQLALYGSILSIIGLLAFPDQTLSQPGLGIESWLVGFTPEVWFCICWQGLGGLIVALTIKHADNILRGFAQGVSIVVVAICSWVLFGFQMTPTFWLGACLVCFGTALYGAKARTLSELCSPVSSEGTPLMPSSQSEGKGTYSGVEQSAAELLAEDDIDEAEDVESTGATCNKPRA